jgi:hypothetical protein
VGEDIHCLNSGYNEYFFTFIKSLLTEPIELTALIIIINALIDTLNFLALTHQITGEISTSELIKEVLEDVYIFIINGISRYDSRCFYKVVINTGVFKYSIVRLKQFQAL